MSATSAVAANSSSSNNQHTGIYPGKMSWLSL
jgi:hypothetical protein